MNIDALVVVLLALAVVVFVGEPLLRRQRGAEPLAFGRELESLRLYKETLYTAIRDLDFDFQTGKVERRDYEPLRRQLESEALHVLRQLDALDPLARLEQELEQRIAQLRRQRPAGEEPAAAARDCHGCGMPLAGDERYCSACGQALASTPTALKENHDE